MTWMTVDLETPLVEQMRPRPESEWMMPSVDDGGPFAIRFDAEAWRKAVELSAKICSKPHRHVL